MSHRNRTWQATRRELLQGGIAAACGISLSGWFDALAARAADATGRRRACILLWMPGGPSQLDTFDPKPGEKNGGPFKAIETNVPGIQICEHLPKMAQQADKLAIVRSMSTKEGDHDRATYYLRTGNQPGSPVDYPSIGALLGKELGGDVDSELPRSVSIAGYRFISTAAFGSGFLGPRFAPVHVGALPMQPIDPNQEGDPYERMFQVRNLERPQDLAVEHQSSRLELLGTLESDFLAHRRGPVAEARAAAYAGAQRMMEGSLRTAFKLSDEDAALRDRYGRTPFGQGCLLARRLIERGVPFVEVGMNGAGTNDISGWDTHQDNFNRLQPMLGVLDNGWSTLMTDLAERGLLETTLVIWMGEFGRTPVINSNNGRDHFPAAWSSVLAGGGIRGGQVVGRTTDNGMEVAERPVAAPDLMATIVRALGLDPTKQNMSNVGRPIRLAEPDAKPIEECLS
ncbi:MAG: DUF1501 domain-containing protein [Pirellulales bacterium]|nr:DUF1501 domain-containing protein [Pirellulales bacterium]